MCTQIIQTLESEEEKKTILVVTLKTYNHGYAFKSERSCSGEEVV